MTVVIDINAPTKDLNKYFFISEKIQEIIRDPDI